MELDAVTIGTVTGIVAAGAKWVFARVDKQFADAEAKADRARAEIKAELDDCDRKHQKCEEDRVEIIREVAGLRAEVKAITRSQGTNTADIKTLKDHQAEGPR